MKTENFSLATSTAVQIFHTITRVIRYDEGSGTGAPLIRVRSLNTGDLDVEMKPGKLIKLPAAVDGIIITNLTANPITGKLTLGAGDVEDNNLSGTVTLDSATLAALESVDLNPASIAPPRTGKFASKSGLAANTAELIFAPGANANGALILSASARDYLASGRPIVLLSNSATPTTSIDGDVYAASLSMATSTNTWQGLQLERPQHVPPGHGLYFFCESDGTVDALRSCRYKML